MDILVKEIMELSKHEPTDINERFIKLSEEFGEIANELVKIKNTFGSVEELKIGEFTFQKELIESRINQYRHEETEIKLKQELNFNTRKEITDVLIRTLVLYCAIPNTSLETLKSDIELKKMKLESNLSKGRL